MKRRIWLMATTALLATSAADATIPANALYISGAQPVTLNIAQDSSNGGNTIGSNGSAFTLAGSIKTIKITQTGTGNSLGGSLKVGTVGSNAANLTQTYKGNGYNMATLNIGASTNGNGAAPTTLSGSIVFDSTADTAAEKNTITETANTSGALFYNIAVNGKSNTLTDILSATGNISNNQSINTDGNTLSNTLIGATTISVTNTIGSGSSDTNAITTTSAGSGVKIVNNTIQATLGSSTITTQFNAVAGAQTSYLNVIGGRVDFGLDSNASSTTSHITLNNVVGVDGIAAKVGIVQTANAAGSSATLTVDGNGFSTSMIGSGTGLGYGIYVYQNTPAAVLNAAVTANSDNYTVVISQ